MSLPQYPATALSWHSSLSLSSSQKGDSCQDCTQIIELLKDLISNPDIQVNASTEHAPLNHTYHTFESFIITPRNI